MKKFKTLFIIFFILITYLFGQSYEELQKLQDEYKKVLERQSLQKRKDIVDAENTMKSTSIPEKLIYSRKDIESLLINTEKLLTRLKFYEDSTNNMPFIGYDFFTNRDSLPFWENLPISKNYILGPGDEVIISVWGESNSYNTEIINRDGQVFIEKIGILNLSNKSVLEAKDYILSKYSGKYSTLLGNSPKSFIDLTLGELKSINVHFVGFVKIPGVHVVHPFSNIITGLIQAGGVDERGTLRDIVVIRNNKIISSTDVYDYFINGQFVNDIRLMDQDIVYVSSRKSTIPITGGILRPGYYEIIENETLVDLIKFSGGRKRRSSSDTALLYRNNQSNNDGYLVMSDKKDDFTISNGDSIHVPMHPDFENYVNIQGQIKNPGNYPYNKNVTLKDILSATMSFNSEDFKKTMNLSKIIVHRKNPSGEEPLKIITRLDENFKLKNGDHITVPRFNFFQPIESIVLTGEAVIPGTYPVNNITTLSNILNQSGGYTNKALEDGIEIFRDSLKIAWDNQDFLLKDGDSLNILKKSGLVFLDGEINVPGYVSYRKSDSIKKYIKRAGGFSAFADKKNIFITYPNGTSIPVSTWSSPKVKEGSVIFIKQRTISGSNNISGWEAFSVISTQASGIATTLLSLSLLVDRANNGN